MGVARASYGSELVLVSCVGRIPPRAKYEFIKYISLDISHNFFSMT